MKKYIIIFLIGTTCFNLYTKGDYVTMVREKKKEIKNNKDIKWEI